jgi:hypothetical protein
LEFSRPEHHFDPSQVPHASHHSVAAQLLNVDCVS